MRPERERADSPLIRPGRRSGRITVLGLGNILLSDEGIGVRAIEQLRERYDFRPEVEIVDGGTMGLDLLPIFEDSEKVLIMDAVDFRRPPGHVGCLEDNEIPAVLTSKMSVHHIGLSDVLSAAKLLYGAPPKVFLIGIQPKSLDTGLDMTEEVRLQLDTMIDLAVRKLKEWNVSCVSRSPQRS